MLDLKELAYKYMKIAQKNLRHYGHLVPIAQFITPNGNEDHFAIMGWNTPEQKFACYESVRKQARDLNALAVVLVNELWVKRVKDYAAYEKHLETYHQGDLERDHTGECIIVTVRSPGSDDFMLMCNFTRRMSGDFDFERPRKQDGGKMMLLRDWGASHEVA